MSGTGLGVTENLISACCSYMVRCLCGALACFPRVVAGLWGVGGVGREDCCL